MSGLSDTQYHHEQVLGVGTTRETTSTINSQGFQGSSVQSNNIGNLTSTTVFNQSSIGPEGVSVGVGETDKCCGDVCFGYSFNCSNVCCFQLDCDFCGKDISCGDLACCSAIGSCCSSALKCVTSDACKLAGNVCCGLLEIVGKLFDSCPKP